MMTVPRSLLKLSNEQGDHLKSSHFTVSGNTPGMCAGMQAFLAFFPIAHDALFFSTLEFTELDILRHVLNHAGSEPGPQPEQLSEGFFVRA
jgi:hypothetical protein